MTISQDFVEKYTSINHNDLDLKTLEAGRNLLIDSLGNIIASLRIGGNEKLNQSMAQSLTKNNNMTPLYLGMLIHSLDFDDTHYEALIHTGSITVPSGIYAAFNKKISGKDFIKSLILGVDFAVQLASIEKHLFHKKGFHATSVVGVFSSAFIYGYLKVSKT
jgi:2-methylcitrate dehydratase PrpD